LCKKIKGEKMKKTLALLVVGCILVGLSATETRVASLGGTGFYIRDNSNIFYFPGSFKSYSGMVISELRVKKSDASYSAGIHLPSTLGIYLNNPVDIDIPNYFQDVTIDNTMDFFYGTQLANFDFGARLAYGLDSYSNDVPDGDSTKEELESARYFALGLGISNDNMDLGLNIELPGAKYEFDSIEETWSGFGFGLNGRMFVDAMGKLEIIPVGLFNMTSSKYEFDTGVTGADIMEVDYSEMQLGVGIGLNYQLSDKDMVVVTIEPFGMNTSKKEPKEETEETNTTIILPAVYAGVESQIKPWLTGRFGVNQVYRKEIETIKPYEGTETSTSQNYKDFAFSFGLGFHFGKFTLDAYVNEGLLFDGPNLISGTTEPMASKLSLTYDFE
jgi:hypothetical protein